MSLERSSRRSSSIDGQWIRDNEAREYKEHIHSLPSDSAVSGDDWLSEADKLHKLLDEIGDLPTISSDEPQEEQIDELEDIDKVLEKLKQARKKIDKNIEQFEAMGRNYGASKSEPQVSNTGSTVSPKPIVTPAQNTKDNQQEIRDRMKQSQEELAKTMEWARQQPNVPQTVSLGTDKVEELPEWTKDKGISGYTEPTLEQIKKGLASETKVQSTIPDTPVEQNNENEDEKRVLIDGIINGMLNAGEFSNSGLDVVRKAEDISYVSEKLRKRSVEELKLLLASYQTNYEDQKNTGGMGK